MGRSSQKGNAKIGVMGVGGGYVGATWEQAIGGRGRRRREGQMLPEGCRRQRHREGRGDTPGRSKRAMRRVFGHWRCRFQGRVLRSAAWRRWLRGKAPSRRVPRGGVGQETGNGKACGEGMIRVVAKLNHVGEGPLPDAGDEGLWFSPCPAGHRQARLLPFAMLPVVWAGRMSRWLTPGVGWRRSGSGLVCRSDGRRRSPGCWIVGKPQQQSGGQLWASLALTAWRQGNGPTKRSSTAMANYNPSGAVFTVAAL